MPSFAAKDLPGQSTVWTPHLVHQCHPAAHVHLHRIEPAEPGSMLPSSVISDSLSACGILSSAPSSTCGLCITTPDYRLDDFLVFGKYTPLPDSATKGSPHRYVFGSLCRRCARERDFARNARFRIRDSTNGQSSGCLLSLLVIQAIVRLGFVTACSFRLTR